jgi:tRNA threonylcarbamoyladenosine biosynthesis protein TsaB
VLGISTRHSEVLLPTIDFLLARAALKRTDIAGLVVAGGPGSFTGIRIAAATVKGLAHALELPLYAYSGLLSLAASVGLADTPVCALFDARRGEVYAACYRFPEYKRIETLLPPTAAHLRDVIAIVSHWDATFVGEGALRYRDMIEERGGVVAPAHLAVAHASSLLWLAHIAPEQGRVDDVRNWQPEYLRDSGAERARA